MAQTFSFIISGKRWTAPTVSARHLVLNGGATVELPRLTPGMVEQCLAQDRFLLRDVPLQEIIAFLHNVGKNWKSKESSRRRIYIRDLVRYLGYSPKMAEHEADWIAMLLCSHYRICDVLDTELGNRHLLDRWVPVEEVELRAFPKGRSLHILPGNVPVAGVISVLRALVTKNICVVKASSRDPITPTALALSFLDVDSKHPVAKAMSVVHWAGSEESPEIRRIFSASDVICAWGGADSIHWASQVAGESAELIKFGPRRSLAIIGQGADIRDTARHIAHDVCMYDQRGCFSVQRIFVDSQIASALMSELEQAFKLYENLFPKGNPDFDECAAWSLARLEALYSASAVRHGSSQEWLIVAGAPSVDMHPLGRTLYVQTFESLAEITPHVDHTIQTVAVTPAPLGRELRDILGAAGACRIVDCGLANVFRLGGTHDGMYPMQRLVRMVSHEASRTVHIKGIPMRIDQTRFLEEEMFEELIP
jgi:long-chain-fatty-acyl-CoA reductase